jgi:hypothetical protein
VPKLPKLPKLPKIWGYWLLQDCHELITPIGYKSQSSAKLLAILAISQHCLVDSKLF